GDPAAPHQRRPRIGGDPARAGAAAAPGAGRPGRGDGAARRPRRRRDPARRPPRPRRRPVAVPTDRDHGQGGSAAGHRQRGRSGRALLRLGVRRPAARHRGARRGRRPAAARDDPGCGRRRRPADPERQHRHRRGRLLREAQRHPAGPHLHRVRAVEVPRAAPRTGVQPAAAAQRRVGLRLLRRHPHGGRPRPAAPGQARRRARVGDRNRPQRRLSLRGAGGGDQPRHLRL
ncbi:MAG: GlnR-family transcriptional regulator, partial [uncultured Friedmanniella sp.]